MNRKLVAWADDVSLISKRVKNWNYVVRKHFTYLVLADYCSIHRDIDKRILSDLLVSNMFFKIFRKLAYQCECRRFHDRKWAK
jgi:hypothetical protein